jgi:hypothetical protein
VKVINPDGQNDTLVNSFRYGTPPIISGVEIRGKNLRVTGSNFTSGSTISIDGSDVATENGADSPSMVLIVRKANKKIDRGQTVVIRVRNPDGISSRATNYQRPG